jgi:hypothetical protein
MYGRFIRRNCIGIIFFLLIIDSLPTRVEYADLGATGSLFADDDDFNLLGEEVPLQFDIEKVG